MYYSPSGEGFNSACLLYDMGYKQWMNDTEIYVGQVALFNSQSDDEVLVCGSSLVGAIYYGDSGYSDLGKPIEFEYRTKYYSFDHPSRKHRIKRLYPYFNAGNCPYYCDVQIDVNESNSPSSNLVFLGSTGATWGGGETWGGGATWGGNVLEPTRLSIPGSARKHQIRFVQSGVDNPVEILGFTTYSQMRKPI
jgi:hypothetical protein